MPPRAIRPEGRFNRQCGSGRTGGLTDAVEGPRFSTIVGLAAYGAHRMALGTASSSAKRMKIGGKDSRGVIEKVKFYLQDFW